MRRGTERAAQRRPGSETARDVDRHAVMLEGERIDDARFVGGEVLVEIAEPPACRSAAISRARLPS